MSEALKKAKIKYESKRVKKTVSFNSENKEDQVCLEFIQSINFSNWVKQKIKEALTWRLFII